MSKRMMDGDDPLIGKTLGHSTIRRKLGQGGMGAVYLAHHPGLNKDIAIKILPAESASSQEFIDRFQREARLAARLEHPNVVQVFDVGQAEGVYYISMQYVEGKSLDAVLKERRKLTVSEALSITKRVAVALSAAAKLGIVHRDIKPHNILISKDGIVKVADFGLAKDNDANRSISETGEVFGTPHYMSPEQASGTAVDHRGDLYSLGCTLYHMLTGKRPFEGLSPVAIVVKQMSEEPVPVRQVEPTVPENVAAILDRLMKKAVAERTQTAEELIKALDSLKTVPATTVGPSPVLPPRRKAAFIALPIAGILVVGIVLGLILGRGNDRDRSPVPVAKNAAKPPAPPAAVKPAAKPVEAPKVVLPPPPPPPPPTPTPRETLLARMKDSSEKRIAEEVLERTDEVLKAIQKRDLKTVRSMLDPLAFGEPTDAQLAEIFAKVFVSDKTQLRSWEVEDVELRPRAFARPHALVRMTYVIEVPKGEMKLEDQPLFWTRRADGRWLLTKAPRPLGK